MNWVSYHWRIKSFPTSFSVGVAAMIRIALFARCRWRIHKKWRWMEYNGFCFRLCRAEIYIDNKSTYKFPPWAPTWDLIPVPSLCHCNDHHDFGVFSWLWWSGIWWSHDFGLMVLRVINNKSSFRSWWWPIVCAQCCDLSKHNILFV